MVEVKRFLRKVYYLKKYHAANKINPKEILSFTFVSPGIEATLQTFLFRNVLIIDDLPVLG